MSGALLDAYDQVAHAEVLALRLTRAAESLSTREGRADEKFWLTQARDIVVEACKGSDALLMKVLCLDELEPVRGERGRGLQGAVVDAVEQLQVAIASAVGPRSPLLEALFRNLKMLLMRKASREEFGRFCGEIEKRAASSYVKRLLADPDYAKVTPVLEGLRQRISDWRGVFAANHDGGLDEETLRGMRDALFDAARRVELPCRQARLLAEAALLTAPDLPEGPSLFEKPKRRVVRAPRATSNGIGVADANANANEVSPEIAAEAAVNELAIDGSSSTAEARDGEDQEQSELVEEYDDDDDDDEGFAGS